MTTSLPVIVRLRLPDGQEFNIHTEISADVSPEYAYSDYWWAEGNGGCDCNRLLYLNRQHGLNLGDDDGWGEPCLPCGDTIALIALTVNGRNVLRTDGFSIFD